MNKRGDHNLHDGQVRIGESQDKLSTKSTNVQNISNNLI